MKIIEQFIMSKTGHIDNCEDIIFTNEAFAAVIDGATARSNAIYGGRTSGQEAAGIARDTLQTLHPDCAMEDALLTITCAFRRFCTEHNIDINDYSKRLTASAVIYSAARMEIWMVGDCQAMINGKLFNNPNGIDEHVAAVRALIDQAELKKCGNPEWLAENDPGAEFIKPLLTVQFLFQNTEPSYKSCFCYSAFDGFDIDPARVKILHVEKGSEIVLASDGYPELFSTLAESEERLSRLLEEDPLCIYENKCVKGIKPGNISFDDRSYIRFSV